MGRAYCLEHLLVNFPEVTLDPVLLEIAEDFFKLVFFVEAH